MLAANLEKGEWRHLRNAVAHPSLRETFGSMLPSDYSVPGPQVIPLLDVLCQSLTLTEVTFARNMCIGLVSVFEMLS